MKVFFVIALSLCLVAQAWGQPYFSGQPQLNEESGVNNLIFNYAPKIYNSKALVDNISEVADQSIYLFSGEGLLQSLFMNFSKKEVEIVLKVDGSEILRIRLEDMADGNIYNIESADKAIDFQIRFGKDDKQIIIDFGGIPSSFDSSFQILAKALTNDVDMRGIIVIFREKL